MRKSIMTRRKPQNDRLMVGVIIPKAFFNHPRVQDKFMEGIEEDDNTSAAVIDPTNLGFVFDRMAVPPAPEQQDKNWFDDF